jgi:benzoylformate decarboxylase
MRDLAQPAREVPPAPNIGENNRRPWPMQGGTRRPGRRTADVGLRRRSGPTTTGDAIIFDEVDPLAGALRWLPTARPFPDSGRLAGGGLAGAIGIKLPTLIGRSGKRAAAHVYHSGTVTAAITASAKFVICNNHGYRILKFNTPILAGARLNQLPTLSKCFTCRPDLISCLAKAMGVAGTRVTQPAEIAPAIKAMLEHDGPFLIDLVVAGPVPPPVA